MEEILSLWKDRLAKATLANKPLLADIRIIIENLEEDHKVPFILLYKGHSYKEISEKLQLPIEVIKIQIYTARRTLRKQVEDKYGFIYYE